MVHRPGVIMFGLAFTCGLLLGLIVHLPQIPAHDTRHARDIRSVHSIPNTDTNLEHKEQLRTLLAQSFSQHQDQESSTMRRVNPEDKYLDIDLETKNVFVDSNNHIDEQLAGDNQNKLDSSKSKSFENKQEHKLNRQSIKVDLNSDKFESTDEIELSESKHRLKLTHSVSVGVLPKQKGQKKLKAVIDIPPYPSKQSHDDKISQHVAVKTSYPSQQASGQTDQKDLHDQFDHLWETVGGIYWSPQLDHLTPVGFGDTQTAQWRHKVESSKITHLLEGCGRMQNRLVVFDDGSQMCARYRINNDQIQGEVYSYYLARVLGIDNVPPAILDRPDATTPRWQNARKNIEAAQWNSRKVLVLTPYVRDLRQVYIPQELRTEERCIAPDTPTLVNKTVDELIELVQWSDLIILDYLTGNVDRVVNNMFNLQWSPGMMSAPTHNLERSGEAGPLIFMDNESGLLHSYRLLDKYSHYHDKLLRSMCIFRKSTADAIKKFHKTGHLASKMKELFQNSDPLAEKLSSLPQSNVQTLNQRLAAVYRQIVHCEQKYTLR